MPDRCGASCARLDELCCHEHFPELAETVLQNGKTWLDMEGNFVDENEHVVERYTLVDFDTIAYEATVTDPTVFTKPWTMKLTLKRLPETEQILEYGCIEGERDLQHYTTQVGGKAK